MKTDVPNHGVSPAVFQPQASLQSILDAVMVLGERKGCTLYNILHRNAGWGIMWHDEPHQKHQMKGLNRSTLVVWSKREMWKLGRVVYQYKPTLREAIMAEIDRLKVLPDYDPEPSSLPQSKDLEQS